MKGFNNALKQLTPVKKPIQTANRGANGYDNPRENIDPHIKTIDISTKNISAATLVEANDLRANNSLIVSGSTIVVKDGKVGIGTASPTQPLSVNGWMHTNTGVYVGSTYIGASGNDLRFGTSNAERLRIKELTGFVGINTTSPSAGLHVNGTVRFEGNTGSLGLVMDNAGKVGIGTATLTSALQVSGGRLSLNNYSTNSAAINHLGQVFVSGGALMYVGTAGTLTVLGAA